MAKSNSVIIKKVVKAAHGHHGGAWKVAYADFITALMAFFLVMWLVGQRKATKAGIAGYFKDPRVFETSRGPGLLDGSQSAPPSDAPETPERRGARGAGGRKRRGPRGPPVEGAGESAGPGKPPGIGRRQEPQAMNLTILLAEDELDVRDLLGDYLESRGHTVLRASDGASALALARDHAGAI